MIFREYQPCGMLAPYIKSYFIIEDDDGLIRNQTMSIYPSGHLEMIISFGDSVFFSRENYHLKNAAGYLGGQILEPLYYKCLGKLRVFSVIFKPCALYTFIRIPQEEFTGYTIDLEMVFSKKASGLMDRICMEPDHAGKIGVLESYFIRLLKDIESKPDQATVAVWYLEKSEGRLDIKTLSEYLNVSLKTLERNFRRQIGITPKEFSRIMRFNKVFNAINAGISDIHDLIYECGYYDQPHFINEFRRFTELNPSSFLKKDDENVDFSLREKARI